MKLTQLKKIIANQFSQKEDVIAVLLYGSQAKGLAKEDSDVDIAILYQSGRVPDASSLWELKGIIEDKLNKTVDLTCLNSSNTIISSQIYKYHEPVLVNDQKALDKYFMFLISDYAELKELRRFMEEHILERKFYGS